MKIQLINNRRKIIHARESQMVSVLVHVPFGSMHEGDQHGLAHYMEHMLFKGTATRTCQQIAAEIESRGGVSNAYTDNDHTLYYIDTPARNIGHAMDVLSDLVLNSQFPAQEAEREKHVVLKEIKQRVDDAYGVAIEHWCRYMWDGTPLSHDIGGTVETVSAITQQDLQRAYARWYNPRSMTVAIVGNLDSVDPQDLHRAFELFDVGNLEVPKLIEYCPAITANTEVHKNSKFDQTYLVMGTACLNFSELLNKPEYRVANAYLGSGMNSQLFRKIREELGLAYSVGSFLSPGYSHGNWVAYACTDSSNVTETYDSMKTVVNNAADYIESQDFEAAKNYYLGQLLRGCETNNGYGSRVIHANYVGSSRSVVEQGSHVEQVTLPQVKDALRDLAQRPCLTVFMEKPT